MGLRDELSALATAFSFFTRLPLGGGDFRPTGAVLYLPLIGVFLGGLNWFLLKVLLPRYGPELAALVILLVQYFLANYFHFDGLLDTLDALSAGGPRERRLRILKSPEVGALGLLFGVLFLLGEWIFLKRALLEGLESAAFFKPLFGRWGLLFGMVFGRPAKSEGLGALFFGRGASERASLAFAALTLFLLWFYPRGTPLIFLALGGVTFHFRRVFGGLTGDLLGALCQLSEFLFLAIIV